MPLTPDEERHLSELRAAFDQAGGRGVELADQIDDLEAKARPTTEQRAQLEVFLLQGGYSSVEDWAQDSDYIKRDGEWYLMDHRDQRVDILECIFDAMDACGFLAEWDKANRP